MTEESVARYSIHDVVLPLPGYDMLYPRNKGGHTIAEKLSSGLQERGYAHKQRVLIPSPALFVLHSWRAVPQILGGRRLQSGKPETQSQVTSGGELVGGAGGWSWWVEPLFM